MVLISVLVALQLVLKIIYDKSADIRITGYRIFEPFYGYPRSSFSSQFFRKSSFFRIEMV